MIALTLTAWGHIFFTLVYFALLGLGLGLVLLLGVGVVLWLMF